MFKAILVLCAQALFVQVALSQCARRTRCPLGYTREFADAYGLKCPLGYSDSYDYDGFYGLGTPYGLAGSALEFSPTSGGGLAVSSASAIAPVGLSVASENIYEGSLAAAGELPFVGTVGVEGVLPTAGAGAVNHHCGDGINAMVSEGIGYGGALGLGYDGILDRSIAGAYGLGLKAPALGYRGGWAGKGCGCGRGLY